MPLSVPRSPYRRRLSVAVAVVALAAASGCTVPIDAVAGISVTADGHLLGVMMVCGHRIDGATLYRDSDDPDRDQTLGSWSAEPHLEPGLTTWPLDAPTAGWTTDTPLGSLTPGATYALYGWTEDNSWSSSSVSFTPADTDKLSPGMVRYSDDTEVTVPMAEFKAKACEDD